MAQRGRGRPDDATAHGRSDHGRRLFRLLAAFAAFSVVLGVLGSALAFPLVATAAASVDAGSDLLTTNPEPIPKVDLPQTARLVAADGSRSPTCTRRTGPTSRCRRWRRTSSTPSSPSRTPASSSTARSTLAGIARAVVDDALGHPIQGASTLTQQYAKNLLLERDLQAGNTAAARADTARTIDRKLRELKLAISIEQHLTKHQILARYLNIVYFGEGVYGVQAAAERYFGVPAPGSTSSRPPPSPASSRTPRHTTRPSTPRPPGPAATRSSPTCTPRG